MPSLLASLLTSSSALNAFDQALQVTQNNVANANTPGYVKQSLVLEAMPFDIETGATGGVRAGQIQSARDQYAEQAVRQQNTLLGQSQQNVTSLTAIQSLFDVTGKSGIPAALTSLYASFSAWTQSPTDTLAQQNVLDSAGSVATAFQQTANALSNVSSQTDQQLKQTVSQVNDLVTQLQGYNVQALRGDKSDPALDAQVNSTLEQLSQYINFTALQQSDGSVTVLLNGQTPLLVADHQYQISYQPAQPDATAPYPGGMLHGEIVDADGRDITSKTTAGQLGALLNIRNVVLPSYIGDEYQAGDLNTMAKQFAQRVNQLLTPVDNSSGSPVQTGVPIFTYDTSDDTRVAESLAVDPTVTAGQLTPVDPGPPSVANGVPLALSNMSTGTNPLDQIQGGSYSNFFGQMASRIGTALNDATGQQQVQQAAVAQAKELRQQASGVSLDEEATLLIQFQRAYEANSRMITVLDQITQDAINILQS